MNNMKKTAAVLGTLISTVPAFAEEAATSVTTVSTSGGDLRFVGMAAIGAGLAIGLAAFGAASGQGKAAASALEGIARNPSAADKMFIPLMLSLAFMEALGILAFLTANSLTGNISSVLAKIFGLN